jgi:succinate dehydrogenase / fumarate reductase iron-sulfur subunit
MAYTIKIKRQKSKETESYWQEFTYEGDGSVSVAELLRQINGRMPLTDKAGRESAPIEWECGCMLRKCGACAMRINGLPRLACSTFLSGLKGTSVVLEPLSKFPIVRDLIVDRSVLFENLKKLRLWLEDEAYMTAWTREQRFQSAKCLMCGCCLEVCPNFSIEGDFAGAIAAVNAFRILDQDRQGVHSKEVRKKYKQHYYEGCGKSLSCHDICPVGLPVEELLVRSNAAAIWGK